MPHLFLFTRLALPLAVCPFYIIFFGDVTHCAVSRCVWRNYTSLFNRWFSPSVVIYPDFSLDLACAYIAKTFPMSKPTWETISIFNNFAMKFLTLNSFIIGTYVGNCLNTQQRFEGILVVSIFYDVATKFLTLNFITFQHQILCLKLEKFPMALRRFIRR